MDVVFQRNLQPIESRNSSALREKTQARFTLLAVLLSFHGTNMFVITMKKGGE